MHLLWHIGRRYPARTIFMLAALMVAGIVEGIGLTALLPVLNLAFSTAPEAGAGTPDHGVGVHVIRALEVVGIVPTIGSLLGVVVTLILVKSVFVLLADKKVGYTVAHVATDLRLTMLRSFIASDWSYFLNQPIGSLANAIATEVMRAAQAYLYGAMTITYLIQAAVYSLVALLVSWKITLAAYGGAVLVVLVLSRLVRKTKRAGRRQTELLQSLAARLVDSLQSVKPLKSMGRDDLADRLLEYDAVKLNHALRKQAYSKAALKGLQEPILTLLVIGGLFATLVIWPMELPTVMMLTFLLARFLGQLGKMQRQYQELGACESAYWSLQAKIAEADRLREGEGGSRKLDLTREVCLDGVSFAYDGNVVFAGIDLTIPAGGLVTVIGHSGAGKTTMVDLLTGLLRPSAGRVLIDGVPLDEIDLRHWRRQIGYVPQDTVLLHDTIRNNIIIGNPGVTTAEVEAAVRAAGASEFIAGMPDGLDTVVGERGGKLSGGQRQRIAIARALAHRPRLLILDEATSALDEDSEAAVCRTLTGLKGRIAMLAISHRPALAELADEVWCLDGGVMSPASGRQLTAEVRCGG
ncbi:MAG: ABC transporter ATP-binding protein [Deltaproteobacteria bacterium]|nr:ABC transporter ATP-binding protein [Candidatus Anaeroferrophillacea bacterium]